MIFYQDCIYLRERLYEILVEPESAPLDLMKLWNQHCMECQECRNIFSQMQKEQEKAEDILGRLMKDVPSLPHSISLKKTEIPLKVVFRKAASIFFVIAASFLLILSLVIIWKILPYSKGHRLNIVKSLDVKSLPLEADAKFKILAEIQSKQREIGEKIPVQKQTFFVEEVWSHIQRTRKEFASIHYLAKSTQQSMEGKNIPFLILRLKLHCRLFLIDMRNLDKLGYLEAQGFNFSDVESLFMLPIHNIGHSSEHKRLLTEFFQKASPHLLSILRYRKSFLERLDFSYIQSVGGENETLGIVQNLEDSL